ncbi:hypothetical protein [Pseudomonas sp. AN-1]|uniref:hypothetical protein n=1 Tax=Pseudomonas sp. AN-1 TaxID=3096605 RepID=UPI002A69BE66|nr:hypothetical protein [Pseudomonas sp. AN-1]WPP47556.1 hypothetical protein SK095_09390 [Pseudomonas sp. AN-1]
MKITLFTTAIFVLLVGCVSPQIQRSPYQMKVTDWSGNSRPYYLAGEAINLHVWWDANYDTGKAIDCSFSNSFNGTIAWRGVLVVPESKPGQLLQTIWNPAFPTEGLKLKEGSYVAVCNFNNEGKASVPLNVVSGKSAQ